jgi:hypothetical protein
MRSADSSGDQSRGAVGRALRSGRTDVGSGRPARALSKCGNVWFTGACVRCAKVGSMDAAAAGMVGWGGDGQRTAHGDLWAFGRQVPISRDAACWHEISEVASAQGVADAGCCGPGRMCGVRLDGYPACGATRRLPGLRCRGGPATVMVSRPMTVPLSTCSAPNHAEVSPRATSARCPTRVSTKAASAASTPLRPAQATVRGMQVGVSPNAPAPASSNYATIPVSVTCAHGRSSELATSRTPRGAATPGPGRGWGRRGAEGA